MEEPTFKPAPEASAPQTPTPPPASGSAAPAQQKTDVMGIVSIIMAFVGLQIIGLIVGLIGVKKAKEEGRSPTLSKIGWILNLVFMILAIIFIVLFLVIGIAASKNSDTLEGAAKNLETSLEESSTTEPNSELVAAYDKVNEGMTKAEVEAILGVPSVTCSSSSVGNAGNYEMCSYGQISDGINITINYKDGVVEFKTKTNY